MQESSTHFGDKEASSASAPVSTQDPKSLSQTIDPSLTIQTDRLSSGSVPHQPDYSGMVSQNHVPTTPVDQQIPPGSIPPNPFSHRKSVPPGFVPFRYQLTPQQSAPPGLFQHNAMHFGSIPQPSVPLNRPPNHPFPGPTSPPITTSGSGPSTNNLYGSVPYVSNHPGFYGQPPRVSQFSGQDQKGDVSFDLWQAEISGLMDAGYPEPVLLHVVRKSQVIQDIYLHFQT